MHLGHYHITSMISPAAPAGVITAKQVHGGGLVDVSVAQQRDVEADALLLRDEPTTIAVYTADCLPLILIGEEVAVALHVSRKTILQRQLEQAAEVMGKILLAYVGPHICADHFTFSYVGDELRQLQQQYPDACYINKTGLVSVSLLTIVRGFLEAHIASSAMHIDQRCTWEDRGLPSYRRSLECNETYRDHIFTLVRREI